MQTDRSQNRNALIGAMLVFGILALMLLIFFIPDLKRWIEPSVEIVALMDEAGALKSGSAVWIAGREAGTVRSVHLEPARSSDAKRVAVRIEIPKKYLSHVRVDSEVRVTSRRVIGDPVLDIIPGSSNAREVREGDTLDVRPPGSLTGVLDRTMSLSKSFEILFADLRSFRRRASGRTAEIERLNRNLNGVMTEFRELTTVMSESSLRTLTDPEFQRMLKNVTDDFAQLSRQLQEASRRAREAKSDAQPSIDRLRARTDTIRTIVADIQRRIEAGGGGLLIRARTDSAIVKGLPKAQEQLDSLIAVTKRNPARFWF